MIALIKSTLLYRQIQRDRKLYEKVYLQQVTGDSSPENAYYISKEAYEDLTQRSFDDFIELLALTSSACSSLGSVLLLRRSKMKKVRKVKKRKLNKQLERLLGL